MAIFTNQATLFYQSTAVSSNVAVGELSESLKITKTALNVFYAPGDRLTYVITLINSSGDPLTGLTVNDDLGGTGTSPVYPLSFVIGSAQSFQNGEPKGSPNILSTAPLTFTDVTVPANGNTVIVYTAEVNSNANPTETGSITNTATAVGFTVSDSDSVYSSAEPILTVTKTVCPVPVAINGTLTYTFVIENRGNREAGASDSVSVKDTFNPPLDDLSVDLDGVPLINCIDYCYRNNTLTTTPGRIRVPAATFIRNADGSWKTVPGRAVLTVKGKV